MFTFLTSSHIIMLARTSPMALNEITDEGRHCCLSLFQRDFYRETVYPTLLCKVSATPVGSGDREELETS